jgi:DNA-binding transcriptional regulator GbsR (MarR family)
MDITKHTELEKAKEQFIAQWGSLGTSWGINRTMAQIHALLMVSPDAISTNEIMEDLRISRGNANTNLRDLVGWGLIRIVVKKGERMEYFEAEKDIWKMFCIISRERKRREVEPVIAVLQRCAGQTQTIKTKEAEQFNKQITELLDFVELCDSLLEKASRSEKSSIVPAVLKLFK